MKQDAPPPDEIDSPESARCALERLLAITDALPALISYVDHGGRYRMCNHAYCRWTGLAREQILGRTILELLGPAVWQVIQPHFEAALAGEPRDFEIKVAHPLGPRWLHAIYTPQRDAQGRVEGIIVQSTEITVRKQAEEKLRWSEEHFRAFVTTSSDVVYRMSPDWSEMRHLAGRDFISNTASPSRRWLEEYIHPEDQVLVRQAIQQAIRTKTHFQLEHRVIRVDGTPGWTFSRAIPLFDAAGEITEWFGTATDVTERRRAEQSLKESEERYRTLFDSIDEGFCVIEVLFDERQRPVDYLFHEVNPAFENQAGMHGATGKRMLEFVADIEPHWLENYGRVALTGEPVRFANEYKGLKSWFDVYAFRVGGPESRKVAVIFNNITQRQAAEDALREAKEHAERASRAKDHFLAQLSHELRTPLTPVLMTAAVMRVDESLPAPVRAQFEMIERNIALEARLIDDLLDLTRVTRGKLTLHAEPCDAHALLGHVVEMVREEAREKRLHLMLDFSAQRSQLHGDSTRLQQVFWNLLRNAVKFTPAGGVIRIRTSDRSEGSAGDPGPRLCMEVSDTGVGFEPAVSERIFEPFEQAGAADAQRFPGLGLGLAIARAIVDLHGGRIHARSPGHGQGATFAVELPVAVHVAKDASPGPALTPDFETGPERPLRLLLVEDDETTLQVLTRLLTLAGHHITTAGTIAGARDLAAGQGFDAVVSDLGLPDGTGIELMEHLHVSYGLRGVALSGYGMEEDLQRSSRAGFAFHLVKPVDVSELRRALRRLTGERR